MRESYGFLLFLFFLLYVFYSLHRAFTHTWTHATPIAQSGHWAFARGSLCEYEDQGDHRSAMQMCSLGFGWVGHCSSSSQFQFHSFGFWFHQEVNNGGTFWVQKDKNLAKAELASFPHLHPHHAPTWANQRKAKEMASFWFGYIPLEALPGIVKQNSFQCMWLERDGFLKWTLRKVSMSMNREKTWVWESADWNPWPCSALPAVWSGFPPYFFQPWSCPLQKEDTEFNDLKIPSSSKCSMASKTWRTIWEVCWDCEPLLRNKILPPNSSLQMYSVHQHEHWMGWDTVAPWTGSMF